MTEVVETIDQASRFKKRDDRNDRGSRDERPDFKI